MLCNLMMAVWWRWVQERSQKNIWGANFSIYLVKTGNTTTKPKVFIEKLKLFASPLASPLVGYNFVKIFCKRLYNLVRFYSGE